jgi:hypothetical protein
LFGKAKSRQYQKQRTKIFEERMKQTAKWKLIFYCCNNQTAKAWLLIGVLRGIE